MNKFLSLKRNVKPVVPFSYNLFSSCKAIPVGLIWVKTYLGRGFSLYQMTESFAMPYILSFCILLISVSRCFSAFEDVGLGARSQGMANSWTAVDDIDSMVLNPATMGSSQRIQFGAHFLSSHRTPQGVSDFRNYSINFLYPKMMASRLGSFGILVREQFSPDFAKERIVQFGYSTWQFLRKDFGIFDFGANIKIMQLTSQDSRDSAANFALDMGAILRITPQYNLGFSLLNINNPSFKLMDLKDKAPFVARLGVSQTTTDYLLSIDIAKRTASSGSDGSFTLNSGFEYLWRSYKWGVFSTRGGMSLGKESSCLNLGGSLKHLASEIYYALQIPLTDSVVLGHAISIVFRFGSRDIEPEYERVIKQEMKYRMDLMEALDESSRREKILREELNALKIDIQELNSKLKELSSELKEQTNARSKLENILERQRRAEQELRELEERRKTEKLNQLRFQFSQDWESYLKLKAGGAPANVLKGVIQRIISQYQNSQIDISQATLELQKIIQSEK